MSERDGRLTVDGDRAVLNFERRLPFPVEVVWSAITDPHERAQWFGETTIEAREGGTIDMVATGPPLPPERKRMTGRILVWDPPHVLEHEWKQPIVEDGVVRYELTADGDGTLLRFTHRGLGVRNASGFLGGTHAFLDRLEAYLTGDELPDWATRRLEVNQSTHSWRRTDMSHNGSDIAAPAMAIAYHSGFGHTAVLAEAVAAGAREAGAHVSVIAVDQMTDADWDILDAADGIVFGSATYMGNVSAGISDVRRTDRQALPERQLAGQGCGGVHELRRQERRQGEHPGVAGGIRGSAPHALGQPGFGRGLEQLGRQRERPQPPGLLAGRGRADRRRRQSGPGASLRCRRRAATSAGGSRW